MTRKRGYVEGMDLSFGSHSVAAFSGGAVKPQLRSVS
ncbi:MAG: hypothetical protein Q7K23_07980 [Pseudomonas sp.]|nr:MULTISPECIES: hypothetical protein [Pseudomonas]MDO8708597.1 hypothetical protein [Pseudomonas sp.]